MFLRPLLKRFSFFKRYELPALQYDYNELEPFISQQQLLLHHTKHHQAYINNLNNALEEVQTHEEDHDQNDSNNEKKSNQNIQLIKNAHFNLGGHINHSIFWKNLSPQNVHGGKVPDPQSDIAQQVKRQFGSFQSLINYMSQKTIGIQGSGWGVLAIDNYSKLLRVITLANQQTLASQNLTVLLNIDVWEHAYYVDYQNLRAQYVKNIWKIVNWKEVQKRFNEVWLDD